MSCQMLSVTHFTCCPGAPGDFDALSETVQLPECEYRVCVNVTINDDNFTEDTELFRILLERSPGLPSSIMFNRSEAEVILLDDSKHLLCIKELVDSLHLIYTSRNAVVNNWSANFIC